MYAKAIANLIGRVFETGLYAIVGQGLHQRQRNSAETVLREVGRGTDHLGKKWNMIKKD